MVVFQQKEEQQGSETGSSSEDQLSETELGIEELQLLLQAMQFRRSVKLIYYNLRVIKWLKPLNSAQYTF